MNPFSESFPAPHDSSSSAFGPLGAPYLPAGPASPDAMPQVFIEGDEMVIRVPAGHFITKAQQAVAAAAGKEKAAAAASAAEFLVVLLHEKGPQGQAQWLVDTAKIDSSKDEHQMLSLAIMDAMSSTGACQVDSGTLRVCGYFSPVRAEVEASLPCVVEVAVSIYEQEA